MKLGVNLVINHVFRSFRLHSTSVSPVLLKKARELVSEADSLEKQLQENFDAKLATRMSFISTVKKELKAYSESAENLRELNDLVSATKDKELMAFAFEDIAATNEALKDHSRRLVASLVKPNPMDACRCIFEIRPGIGGDEAVIFAKDVFEMYTSYCSINKWPVTLMHVSTSGKGVEEAVFSVDKEGAFGHFNGEAGVHRVQRIPATESKGRTHTSTASVHVLPMVDEDDSAALFDVKDVKVEIMRSRGAGGQHVNTTDSAVRLTHIPTGISVSMQDARSQHQNRAKAWLILSARLADRSRLEAEAKDREARRAQVSGTDRSDKIRTYNWAQQRVTDHRCGYTMNNLDQCMRGEGLGSIIEDVQKWKQDLAINELESTSFK